MRYVHHTVVLHGDKAAVGRVHLLAGGLLLQQLHDHLQRSVLMRFRGRSVLEMKRPAWLERVMDVRLVGVENQGGTVLRFEAPCFGEAAEELYQQRGLWELRPEPGWTAFETYSDVLRDLAAEAADSDCYDRAFLRSFRHLDRPMGLGLEGLGVEDTRAERTTHALLTRHTLQVAARLGAHVPAPREATVEGVLDMLRNSTNSFALRLTGGEQARGELGEGDVSTLAPLLGRRVRVEGRAVYRASGRLLRMDARAVHEVPEPDEAVEAG